MTDEDLRVFLNLTPEQGARIIPNITPERRMAYVAMWEAHQRLREWEITGGPPPKGMLVDGPRRKQ